MSPVEETQAATNDVAETKTDAQVASENEAELRDAVKLADEMSATSKDKKNTAITLLTSAPEVKDTIREFLRKVKLQADSAKKIYALSVEMAQARNAGKPVPPSKQKKAKPGATAS